MSCFEEEVSPVVIDYGTYSIKAGLANQTEPSVEVRNLVGKSKRINIFATEGDVYVGNEVLKWASRFKIIQPIQNGIIVNEPSFDAITDHIFWKELNVYSSAQPVVVIKPSQSPLEEKEEFLCNTFFGNFDVPSLSIRDSAITALFSVGRTTGVIVDSGHAITKIVAIYEGKVIPESTIIVPLAGDHLTEHMVRILSGEDSYYETRAGKEAIRTMKEKAWFLAEDYDREFQNRLKEKNLMETFELPDGQSISVTEEIAQCPELLFNPSLLDGRCKALQYLIEDWIMACNEEVRDALWYNIVLSGGNSMFEGFGERVYSEIKKLAPEGTKVRIICGARREYQPWKGGSILAKLSSFSQTCITKQAYYESGSSIID